MTSTRHARQTPGNRDEAARRAGAMAWIPGGTFRMGSAGFYPEERPVHRVAVDGFWMDRRPVTVEEFRRFAQSTGYVTVAERALDRAAYPEADPDLLVPGSLVFRRPPAPVDLGRPERMRSRHRIQAGPPDLPVTALAAGSKRSSASPHDLTQGVAFRLLGGNFQISPK